MASILFSLLETLLMLHSLLHMEVVVLRVADLLLVEVVRLVVVDTVFLEAAPEKELIQVQSLEMRLVKDMMVVMDKVVQQKHQVVAVVQAVPVLPVQAVLVVMVA
jgi:hypothetical protein